MTASARQASLRPRRSSTYSPPMWRAPSPSPISTTPHLNVRRRPASIGSPCSADLTERYTCKICLSAEVKFCCLAFRFKMLSLKIICRLRRSSCPAATRVYARSAPIFWRGSTWRTTCGACPTCPARCYLARCAELLCSLSSRYTCSCVIRSCSFASPFLSSDEI